MTEQRGGNDRQAAIRTHADGVGQSVRLTPGVQPRHSKTAVSAEFDSDLWPGSAQTLEQAAQDQHHEARFVTPARTQDGGDELVGLAIEHQQWVVDVLAVKAVIGPTLLVAMDRIISSVDVEHQVGRGAAPLLLADVQRHQCLGHRFTGVTIDRVLQT